MARIVRLASAIVAVLLVATASASLHAASHDADKAAAKSKAWDSPHIDVSSQDAILRLMCGSLPQKKCLDVLMGAKQAGAGAAAHAVAKNVAAAIASMVRTAPLLSMIHPGLPDDVYAFAKHANAKIGAATAAMMRDEDIVAVLTDMRRSGEWREFAGVAPNAATDDYPYFGFLPKPVASGVPGAPGVIASTECFKSVTIEAEWTNESKTSITAKVTTADQVSFLCTDNYMLGLAGLGIKFASFDVPETRTYVYPIDFAAADASRQWYVSTQGVRLSRLNKGFLGCILDVVATVTLILGFGQNPVTNATMKANFEFMQKYVEASPRMQPMSQARSAGRTVADGLNESYIQSGDSLIVVRYDGLDPVIGWGEGFTAGHSVIAVRSPTNGTLYVCESTALDAYWPKNGIQCHDFRTWINMAVSAEYNVLLAPLSAENAAAFNSTAALEFWKETEGLNYGYLNFLFGWLDVKTANFPCLPPTYDYCLGFESVETIALLWDKAAGNTPNNVFRQALNQRLDTSDLTVEQVMMEAAVKHNLTFSDVYVMPEQDSWRYRTERYGQPVLARAMVCCVFVCHMWKHGGLFDSIDRDVNCGEQTLWDIYSMQMFDPAKLGPGRPEICKSADPGNQLCQLVGTHTFSAKPDFNTRPLYKQMGQKCSSLAPDYVRADGC